VDVVVIGAGCGGASAAYHLGKQGYRVALLEKDAGYGKALKGVNGYFAVDSKYQREKHYMAKPKDCFQYLMDHAHWGIEPKIVSDFVNRSGEICHWLTENGAQIENIIAYFPGCDHTWIYMPQNARIYHVLVPALEQMDNVLLKDRTSAKKILTDGGRVTGVLALDEATGQEYTINARAAVVATGEDQVLMQGTELSPYKGANMAEELGAARLRPTVASNGGGPPADGDFRQPCNLFVNLDGQRFTNEEITVRIDDMAFCASTQKNGEYFVILDENINQWYLEHGFVDFKYGMGKQTPNDLKDVVAGRVTMDGPGGPEDGPEGDPPDMPGMPDMAAEMRKQLIYAETLEELAEKTGLPLENLKKTIAEYNEACLSGRDPLYYKNPDYLVPLIKPPYFANKRSAALHDMDGVIKTNANMEVLNTEGDPIPGLYAVGGVCSPINGQIYTHRCAGSRATFALLGGRIVSEHLPAYLKDQK
jgi:fumarate reductase flavoprotein subunit